METILVQSSHSTYLPAKTIRNKNGKLWDSMEQKKMTLDSQTRYKALTEQKYKYT